MLSALLMAAHFSRADNIALSVLSLVAPVLLLVRKPWVARAFQLALVLGALEWVRTLVSIAQRRHEMGEPWLRMAAILGVVSLFTALSALVFRSKSLKQRYSSSDTM